ncbi:MAG: 3-hydroxyacyl-ACP dehydratase FabZ [Gammaproteobacteria bacterium]|nr:3-hydroxyacyl-ACP dehydratase FabZ [Gammaproteobacteria bacterium]
MKELNIYEVMKFLPHRYPFLLIDKVVDYKENETLHAIKNVSMNEPFFQGHFPEYPVMPGVLILEALAQATGILAFQSMEQAPGADNLYLFVGIDNARFKRQVIPGDQLHLKVKLLKEKRGIWKFEAGAYVGDELAASATLMGAAREKNQ